LNGYLEELCDALFLDFLERADSSWHEGTLEELAGVKYGKNHKKLADGPYPVYGSGGFMRSAEKSLFSGESVLIPRKGSLNNVMYVNEAFWTVDTMFFTVPRIPGAAKFLYQYVKRLDLASMNSGSAVPSMTTSILNALSLPVPPRDSLLSFNAKLQSMYDAVRANNLENRRLESLRDSLLPKLMTGEIDVSKIDLTQLNSHLA
ncbi:MAG: restriction endonuclease subunit S, partial [Eggerthellaceae bacterium]|nr:restriction endonuclease subunit S [Eggerthellaceae bacterium]